MNKFQRAAEIRHSLAIMAKQNFFDEINNDWSNFQNLSQKNEKLDFHRFCSIRRNRVVIYGQKYGFKKSTIDRWLRQWKKSIVVSQNV